MEQRKYIAYRLSILIIFFTLLNTAQGQDLVKYINSNMGIPTRGNVVIGPQLPFAAITPSPDTRQGGTDGYSPKQKIRGFSQLHVTGTGGPSKYGVFLISPQIGLNIHENGHDSEKSDEEAHPYSYKVNLTDYHIQCELSPTKHAAIYRFVYPKSDDAHLLIDLGHSIPTDIFSNGYTDFGNVTIDPENQIIKGWAHYWGGWSAEGYSVYFAAKYSKRTSETGTWKDTTIFKNTVSQKINKSKERIGAFLGFDTKEGEVISVKIAVSFVSSDQALKFLDQEIPDWDLERVKSNAKTIWNYKMKKIVISGTTDEQKTIFYSCLYNTMRMPHDRSGDNPSWPTAEPYWDDHYCVWDTWKTAFPLNILINESMVRDNVKAFIDRFKHNGQVLDAFIAGNDRVMEWRGDGSSWFYRNQGGDDVDNIIADAYVKKMKGIDWNEAYKLLKNDADRERAPSYRIEDRGWVPYQSYGFGLYCSRTIEFAYNDFCVAQMAKGLNKANDYQRYLKRSHGWQNLWNAGLESDGYKGFIAPKRFDGTWVPMNPHSDRTAGPGSFLDPRSFYEGSSWIYSYVLPHDFLKLINLSGGNEKYAAKLQYAMGKNMIQFSNEPSFLTPFSFIYCERPDLASYWVRQNFPNYTNNAFPGDEDSGAMGSWYVFSSMGFFPVAGQNLYLLNGPLFPKTVITMENNKQITVEGVNASDKNIYVQSATLNDKALDRAWITHDEISNGATLKFIMGSTPSNWGKKNPPPSN